jgi:hypothetical protein
MSTEDGSFVSKGEVRKVSKTANIASRGATLAVDWNYVRGADFGYGKLVRDELVV